MNRREGALFSAAKYIELDRMSKGELDALVSARVRGSVHIADCVGKVADARHKATLSDEEFRKALWLIAESGTLAGISIFADGGGK